MSERNHEVIIDSYVYPDVVTVTLSNDDFIGSRDYVGKKLYENVIEANAEWQALNTKLRKLVRDMREWAYVSEYCDIDEQFADKLRELGIETG